MRSVEGDPMIRAYPQDVVLYARSSYYYNDMFIIYLFLVGSERIYGTHTLSPFH